MQSDAERNYLPEWLGLIAPPLILFIFYLARYVNLDFYLNWMEGERGIIENLGPLLLLPAIYCGIASLRYRKAFPQSWISLWFLLHAIGAFYFAGEEISWGQHFFNWQTPETISSLNDQNETNLHNMSSWLDQKPRILLWVWALTGGFFAPLLIMIGLLKTGGPEDWRYWVIPPRICMMSGLLVGSVRLPEYLSFYMGVTPPFPFDIRASELQELFLTMFLSFYLVSVYRRVAAQSAKM
ncbi:MAG TPA: hypothetical protein VFW37_14255 [Alphaproteobacteria bacterium]|nr:hypothetical protein [Alphaproteobacteria bacterium]